MRIAIAGCSGFIGSYMRDYFTSFGYKVVPITRDDLEDDYIKKLSLKIDGSDAVINLAGATINRCWSSMYKRVILNSRVSTTKKLVDAINHTKHPPLAYINASAVGYYALNDCYNELNGVNGDNFLAFVCQNWEDASLGLRGEIRRIIVRMGVICAEYGGAFSPIFCAARYAKLSFQFGNGRQRMSWISIDDLVAIYRYVINSDISGVINATATFPLRNKEMCNMLLHKFGARKIILPKQMLWLTHGERGDVIIGDQCVYPLRIKEYGFKFQFEKFEDYLAEL